MITEDYVSFETSKLLKEKGFNEECWNAYTGNNWTYEPPFKNSEFNLDAEKSFFTIPTLQMAMKWLRKQHEYIILFDVSAWGTYDWYYIYKGNRYHYEEMTFEYNEKEEAAESAIKYCLEKLI